MGSLTHIGTRFTLQSIESDQDIYKDPSTTYNMSPLVGKESSFTGMSTV